MFVTYHKSLNIAKSLHAAELNSIGFPAPIKNSKNWCILTSAFAPHWHKYIKTSSFSDFLQFDRSYKMIGDFWLKINEEKWWDRKEEHTAKLILELQQHVTKQFLLPLWTKVIVIEFMQFKSLKQVSHKNEKESVCIFLKIQLPFYANQIIKRPVKFS